MFDLTISLGSLLTIASFVVVITVYVVTGSNATKLLDARLEMVDAQMEDFKTEIKKMAEVLIRQTEQAGRMDRIEDRQLAEGKRLDELTHRLNNK